MITNKKSFPAMIFYPGVHEAMPCEILYFDIETTGFQADSSYLSIIGIMTLQQEVPVLTQYIAEDITDERELLISFFTLLKEYKLLIHYNGSSFDMPYLLKKVEFYRLSYSFSGIKTLDLYKEIKPFKKLFGLTNLKLRTVEEYLGIHRKDTYTGEELIEIYIQFIGRNRFDKFHESSLKLLPDYELPPKNSGLAHLPAHGTKELLSILLLHNEEDLLGLISCTELLYLLQILKGDYTIVNCCHLPHKEYIKLCIKPDFTYSFLKASYSLMLPFFAAPLSLALLDGIYTLFIPLQERVMKYFFSDYDEYYYLPAEDRAVHKSIAQYVDKSHRQKAKKSNCYQKKTGYFLPQPQPLYEPVFKDEFKDKITHFEINEAFLQDSCQLKKYIRTLFHPDIY